MLSEWLNRFRAWWRRTAPTPVPAAPTPTMPQPAADLSAGPLERVVLTEGVAQTLFEDYRSHRRSPRGQEEIGWVLLGVRKGREVLALAALPAGTQREAGIAHVQFNSDAQELASRILRQHDKRLTIVGVVHTHPGDMRYPSEGDHQGDARWVSQLRGDGVFGIGTADGRANEPAEIPKINQQTLGELCFSWYALGHQDTQYRPLAVQITDGPDLASGLKAIWNLLEIHAKPLNRLCRQLSRVQLEVALEGPEQILVVRIALAPAKQQLHLLLNETEALYYWNREDELVAIDPGEQHLERAVYLILAELAKESPVNVRDTSLVALS